MPKFTINVSIEGNFTLVVDASSIAEVDRAMKIEAEIKRLSGWPIWDDAEISYQVSHGASGFYDATGTIEDDFIDF